MKREELDKFIGEYVAIDLVDGYHIAGKLFKSMSDECKNDVFLSTHKNMYYVRYIKEHFEMTSCIFRCSHVYKCSAIMKGN